MHSYAKQSWLTTKGNRAVKAAGQPVFLAGSKSPNVMSGEIVVYNPDTNLTVAAADVLTQSKVRVAVGYGPDNQLATTLRHFGDLDICQDKVEALVTSPVCGTPQVVDVFFDGTKCRSTYGFNILLDDYVVRSNNPQNDFMIYPFNITNPCGSKCDCTIEDSCEKLTCRIVDAINKKTNTNIADIAIFQNRDDSHQYQPFKAARLWNQAGSIRTFTLASGNSDCAGTCLSVPAITGIAIGETETQFTNTTAVVDATTVTLAGQLDRVLELINAVLEPTGGSAHLSHSINGCCSYKIQISSCSEEVITLLSGEDDPIEAVTSNAFSAVPVESICDSCDSSEDDVTFTCGFRLYVDPIKVDCLCEFPPNVTPPMNYFRTVRVQPAGDAWDCASFYSVESSKQVLDEGFGYFYQDLEHYQDNAGPGRNYRMSNTHRGQIGLPDAHSRSTNATTFKCKESYCIYNMVWSNARTEKNSNAITRHSSFFVGMGIPSGDSTTKTSWQTYLAKLDDIGACSAQDITC